MGGAVAGMTRQVLFFFFFSNCDGALPGLGALRKQHTLHINIVNIAQTGPQGHFSVGPQRGRGSSPPGPPLCTPLILIIPLTFQELNFSLFSEIFFKLG